MDLFSRERIIQRANVPQFFVHGPRWLEIVDGGLIRVRLCEDQAVIQGLAPMSVPVVDILTPLANYVWNTTAHVEWAFDRGLLRMNPCGPTVLRPAARGMH